MTQVTVKELAQEVAAPVERLLQQMREAGLPHTDAGQVVTDNEKQALLAHLKSSHKAKAEEPRKITLQRKTQSTLRVAGSKSISVEVRKKKVFVQRSPEEIQAEQKRELEERRAAENAARQKPVHVTMLASQRPVRPRLLHRHRLRQHLRHLMSMWLPSLLRRLQSARRTSRHVAPTNHAATIVAAVAVVPMASARTSRIVPPSRRRHRRRVLRLAPPTKKAMASVVAVVARAS
jgi:hypothetical protein